MDLEDIHQNVERRDIEDTTGPQTLNYSQDEGKDETRRGSRRLVLMTVCLGVICVILLVSIIAQHISNTAERESLFKSNKNTVEEFNQTINSLQDNYTELMTEKDQLKNNFNSLSQKNLQLETRVKDLTAEKNQLQGSVESLSQKNLQLETRVKDLTAEKNQLQGSVESLSQKNLQLETRVKDLTAEKNQLQGSVESLSQKKLELESKVTSLSEKLKTKEGCLCRLDGLLISNKEMSWSDSRQYCRDRGADLVIINTEEKQRSISSFFKESVWIGLTDIEREGNMKWVDNSPLKQGFWMAGEPNDAHGNEDCVEMSSCSSSSLTNWNDLPCSAIKKGVCEK